MFPFGIWKDNAIVWLIPTVPQLHAKDVPDKNTKQDGVDDSDVHCLDVQQLIYPTLYLFIKNAFDYFAGAFVTDSRLLGKLQLIVSQTDRQVEAGEPDRERSKQTEQSDEN